MSGKKLDLTGQRFGRLVVVERAPTARLAAGAKTRWVCRCDCGEVRTIVTGSLRRGTTQSCGCLAGDRFAERLMNERQSDAIREDQMRRRFKK